MHRLNIGGRLTCRQPTTLPKTVDHEERVMVTDPKLTLDLHAARAVGLRAEATRYRLVRALRRRSSAPDSGGVNATAQARRWWPQRRSAALS